MLLTTILAALMPVAVEGVKQVITRVAGGVKPTSIAEQLQLESSDIERLKALAALDAPVGTPSQWVIDLRASSRYVGALTVIAVGLLTMFIPDMDATIQALAFEAANVCFGFLFGARMVNSFKK